MTTFEFLEKFRPGGPWVLTAISVDQKSIDTSTISTEAGLSEWLEQYQDRNLYFMVNPARTALESKASRKDVLELAWLHIDIDYRTGEDPDAERERILSDLTADQADVPRPTCVLFSGGGYQAFWRLEEPFPIDGVADKAEEAKLYNLQLELRFGADSCHNVDRIMRLPGTINRPNAKKRKRGRVPTEAVVEWFEDSVYPLDRFTKAARVQDADEAGRLPGSANVPAVSVPGNVRRLVDVDELDSLCEGPIPTWLKVLVVQGNRPDDEEPYSSRSEALFSCCCNLIRYGIDDETLYSVITDQDFRISESVLDKGGGTERYALRQIERAREFVYDPELSRLNERYAVVQNASGKCRVIEEVDHPLLNRSTLTFLSFTDFRNAHLNRKIEVQAGEDRNGNPKFKLMNRGEWWLQHSARKEFERIVFVPGRDIPGSYNLWRGYACDAIPGDCSLFLDHVRENVCSGVEEYYRYLLGWMARAVQFPAQQGHTAVVLRGNEGSGKSFFAEQFGSLFGRHYLAVSNSKHLVGEFNGHLQDAVVLFADEAFYAGDKRHASVLKTLITQPKLTIERKGIDASESSNCIHLIMASNEDWVVPAGIGDRRFFVLDVAGTHTSDVGYFVAIQKQMDAGGREALLHYLMNYDLSGYEVRDIPATKALQEQKQASLSPDLEWWFQCLWDGELQPEAGEWTGRLLRLTAQRNFASYLRGGNRSRRGVQVMLGMTLRRVLPQDVVLEERVYNPIWAIDLDGRDIRIQRPRYYVFPDLQTCRDYWDSRLYPVRWPPPPKQVAGTGEAEVF